MKLPWLSRAEHERVCERFKEELTREYYRYTDLLARYHEARAPAPGVVTASQATWEPAAQQPREPDPVAHVIREQAFMDGRTDYELAAHLRNYAWTLKREGLTTDEIVGKLVAWQSTEVEPTYDRVG